MRGVAGAAFEHWYSRAGDPQLHTHVATSAMVQTTDGRWRRLDSRALYRAAATAGERYTARLMDEVSARLGLSWCHRRSGRSTTLLPEVAGVESALIKAFSARSAAIGDGLAALVGSYKERHGYAPDRATLARLAQQATLSDRPAGAHRSLAGSEATWRAEAAGVLGCQPGEVSGRLMAAVREARGELGRTLRRGKAARQARLAVGRLEEVGATWSAWELRRAVAAQLREAGYRADGGAVDKVFAKALRLPEVVALVLPERPEDLPEVVRRADGSSAFERRGEERYTSRRVLGSEAALVALARARRLPPAEESRRAPTLLAELTDDQLALASARARDQLAGLQARLAPAHADAPAAQDALARLGADLATYEGPEGGPGLRLVRPRLAEEEFAAGRVGEIDAALERAWGRPRGPEREQLVAERAALVGRFGQLREPADARARQAEAALGQARREDAAAREGLVRRCEEAKGRDERAASQVSILGAELAEVSGGAGALSAELVARQAAPGRVSLTGYLEGLGADQAAAVVRLADPSRPLDALVGPAGAGKTTALGRLVRAFSDAGRAVHVLAPTAVAAQALGEAVGAPHTTLHAALGAWRKGRGLPARGDLVIIDEASMATTPVLLEAARLAAGRGAAVRLVGDPNQLKAVGAGGGLALVAEAVAAPELTELRRFRAAWEAEANLGLRRGDPRALEAYFAHGRVAAALDVVRGGGGLQFLVGEPGGAGRDGDGGLRQRNRSPAERPRPPGPHRGGRGGPGRRRAGRRQPGRAG